MKTLYKSNWWIYRSSLESCRRSRTRIGLCTNYNSSLYCVYLHRSQYTHYWWNNENINVVIFLCSLFYCPRRLSFLYTNSKQRQLPNKCTKHLFGTEITCLCGQNALQHFCQLFEDRSIARVYCFESFIDVLADEITIGSDKNDVKSFVPLSKWKTKNIFFVFFPRYSEWVHLIWVMVMQHVDLFVRPSRCFYHTQIYSSNKMAECELSESPRIISKYANSD